MNHSIAHFSFTQKTYIESMPGSLFRLGLTCIAGLVYGDMSKVSDNSVANTYIQFDWPRAD